MAFQEVSAAIEGKRTGCVEFLSRICSIPALGPDNQGTGEMAKFRVIEQTILDLKPDRVEYVHAPDPRVPGGVRPNFLAVFHGRDTSRTLWILSHMDVVPPGEMGLWNHDPFDPYVEDGFLYGRGVEDNGQAIAASIYAVGAAKATCGLAINVGLALVSDEECGSAYGLDYVLRVRPDMFRPDDLILVPDAGNNDGDHIEVAEKHLLQIRFTVRGTQAHASNPDSGRNSLRAAAHFIVALDRNLKTKFPERNPFFKPEVSTFEPTRKDTNVPNVNTIPGQDVFYFDCRVLPEVDLDQVLKEMEGVADEIARQFGVETAVEEYLKFVAPEPTPPDSPVVVALARAVQEVYGVQARPHGIGGQTVAAFFRKRGLPAAVWEKILQTAHAPNERILLDNLIGNAKVFARMMI